MMFAAVDKGKEQCLATDGSASSCVMSFDLMGFGVGVE